MRFVRGGRRRGRRGAAHIAAILTARAERGAGGRGIRGTGMGMEIVRGVWRRGILLIIILIIGIIMIEMMERGRGMGMGSIGRRGSRGGIRRRRLSRVGLL